MVRIFFIILKEGPLRLFIQLIYRCLEEIEKWLHLAKGSTQQASASRTVPCFYGEQGEILYPHQSLVYNFFSASLQPKAGIR